MNPRNLSMYKAIRSTSWGRLRVEALEDRIVLDSRHVYPPVHLQIQHPIVLSGGFYTVQQGDTVEYRLSLSGRPAQEITIGLIGNQADVALDPLNSSHRATVPGRPLDDGFGTDIRSGSFVVQYPNEKLIATLTYTSLDGTRGYGGYADGVGTAEITVIEKNSRPLDKTPEMVKKWQAMADEFHSKSMSWNVEAQVLGAGSILAGGVGVFTSATGIGAIVFGGIATSAGLAGIDANLLSILFQKKSEYYAKLAVDPYDPNYATIPRLSPFTISLAAADGHPELSGLIAASNAFFANSAQEDALLVAIYDCFNRASSADMKGDTYWAGQQTAAARAFTVQLAGLLERQAPLLKALQDEYAKTGSKKPQSASLVDLQKQRLTAEGLDPLARSIATALGYTAADVERYLALLATASSSGSARIIPDDLTYSYLLGMAKGVVAEAGASYNPVPRPLIASGGQDGRAVVFTPVANGQYTSPVTLAPFGAIGTDVRTAAGDVNGDGVTDYILSTGPGTPIRLAVVSGTDNRTPLVPAFDPFGGNFTGGGFTATADLDGDGRLEFVVTPDVGGGPRVSIFALGEDGQVVTRANFFGIDDPNFRGGARAALGDVSGDGIPDLAVAAGFQGGPRTAIFDGLSLFGTPTKVVNDFFAFPGEDATRLRNGVYVTIGDVDGDGLGDLIFGGGPGGGPRVLVLNGKKIAAGDVDGAQAAPLANFFVAGDSQSRGGVRVATVNADRDTRVDLAVGSGSNVRVYHGKGFVSGGEPVEYQDLTPLDGSFAPNGAFVG